MRSPRVSLLCLAALLVTLFSTVAAAAPRVHPTATTTFTVFDWKAFETSPTGAKVIKAWEHMHPGVTVKYLPYPPGDPNIWIASQLSAGTAPDVIVPYYTQQLFYDTPKHWWVDLTPYLRQPNPYITGNKHWSDSIDPVMNAQNAFAGHTYYVLSWQAQDVTFFYNKDLFRKAGIAETPTTWAQLLADASKIKQAGYVPFNYALGDTYSIGENGSAISLFENQVMSKTFQRLDTNHDGFVDIKELVYGIKHKVYSPMNADYQEAWKLFKGWSQYWQPSASGDKGPYNAAEVAADQLFLQGKAAMTWRSTGFPLSLAQAKVPFKWGYFKMPQVTAATSRFATPGQKGWGIWGAWNGDSWAIPTSTVKHGHLALALDFLRWISVPRNEIPVDLEGGLTPVVKGWQPSDAYNTFAYDELKHPTVQFAGEVALGNEWLQQRIATQQAYVLGMESLQQAMTEMQRYTDQAADRAIQVFHLKL